MLLCGLNICFALGSNLPVLGIDGEIPADVLMGEVSPNSTCASSPLPSRKREGAEPKLARGPVPRLSLPSPAPHPVSQEPCLGPSLSSAVAVAMVNTPSLQAGHRPQATYHPGRPRWLSWQRIRLQCRRPGLHPWVGRICWRKEQTPTPAFWPGEFRGLYSPWGDRVGHD